MPASEGSRVRLLSPLSSEAMAEHVSQVDDLRVDQAVVEDLLGARKFCSSRFRLMTIDANMSVDPYLDTRTNASARQDAFERRRTG